MDSPVKPENDILGIPGIFVIPAEAGIQNLRLFFT